MSLFTGGIATALALGASSAASVASAKMNSSAAKQASDQQAAAAQAALDYQKAQKAKQEAAAAPYLALGAQAVGNLPNIAQRMPFGGPPAPFTTQPRQALPLSSMGMNPYMPPVPGQR